MSIATDITRIQNAKTAIKTAIENKGVTVPESTKIDGYSALIDDIGTGGGSREDRLKKLLDTTKSAYYLFSDYSGASVNDLISYNDTENVISMGYMFNNCSNLTTIPQLNTNNTKYMYNMFYSCTKLTTIQLNTSSATDMSRMFAICSRLTTIDITHMNITSTSNSSYFAQNCYSLTKLIIRNMTTIPALGPYAFQGCYHFTGQFSANYNPNSLKDGRIYVPDDKVDALKTAENWSTYADIIVPLSTLVE